MSQQRMGFGPWSSALDNGTRLELSAFWRRRMAGLGRLPLGPVSRRAIAMVGAVAVAVLSVPLLRLTESVLHAEEASREEASDQGSELLRTSERNGAPLLKALSRDHGYRLAKGQSVKRVAPPFPEERMEWYRVANPGQAESIPRGPDSMLFHCADGKLNGWGMTFGQQTLLGILNSVANVYPQDIVGLADGGNLEVTGDWVVDPTAPVEERLEQLEAILNSELSLGINLRFEGIERDVYVASGEYKFEPLPGQPAVDETQLVDRIQRSDPIQVFGAKLNTDGRGGGGCGDIDEFFEWAGRWVDGQIVNELQAGPKNQLCWRLHEPSGAMSRDELKPAHDPKLVLPNITKQTGIEFALEKRKVRVLRAEFETAVEKQ